MSISIDKNRCCGCMACYNACGFQAIRICQDNRGFLYPEVDQNKCKDCGKCEQVCDYNLGIIKSNEPRIGYSFSAYDHNVLKKSTSGGAFTVISDEIIRDGGIVVGTYVGDDFHVTFSVADDFEKRDLMRGSVYTQSDVGDIYTKLKTLLLSGKKIAFVGTPCQVAGLKAFLRNEYDNLLLIEILCHGVPSNKLLQSHIKRIETKYNKKVVKYTFRDKRFAWWTHGISEVTFADGTCNSSYYIQSYLDFFQRNLTLRESCYVCPYKRGTRCADITLGDLWDTNLSPKKKRGGVSLITLNSEKALSYESLLKSNGECEELDPEYAQKFFSSGTRMPKVNRDEMWECYADAGYEALENKYYSHDIKRILRFYLKKSKAKHEGIRK